MIALGSDHGGFEIKEAVKSYLISKGEKYKDFGTYSLDSVDYPKFALEVADSVASGECEKGILCCGTGIGVSIVANKVKGIRAALCNDEFCAEVTRKHNDSNILCMGGRIVSKELAVKLSDIFLNTGFEGGRHSKRIAQISDIESVMYKD